LFLDQSLTRVQDNIKQRGRDFEQNIKLEYLRKIEEAYAQWIFSSKLPIERFSLKELDFVKRSADFHQLLLRFFRL
jgi:deoxyguanosine kinase